MNNVMRIDNLIIIIIIKGGSYYNVKKTLQKWIQLYADDLKPNTTFELYKSGYGNHIIKADDKLDNDHFFYLVNHLYSIENIDFKIDIEGFTTASKDKQFLNKKLLVYMDKDTKEDNVLVVTEDNETFKIDFGGKIKKVKRTKTYELPYINLLSTPEIIKSNKKRITQKKQEKSANRLKKRFKIISLIVLVLFVVSTPVSFINKDTFTLVICTFGVGLWGWFFLDYKMLRENKYYGYCFLIALFFLGYCFFLQYIIKLKYIDNLNSFDIVALIPISFLMVQRPLRFCFKKIIGREPTTERDARKVTADSIYALLLIFATMLCIFFYIMLKSII
jgi:hypothetical protein